MTDYYIARGDVRGDCLHLHESVEDARKCIARDQRGCTQQGGYSDRAVYAYDPETRVATLVTEPRE